MTRRWLPLETNANANLHSYPYIHAVISNSSKVKGMTCCGTFLIYYTEIYPWAFEFHIMTTPPSELNEVSEVRGLNWVQGLSVPLLKQFHHRIEDTVPLLFSWRLEGFTHHFLPISDSVNIPAIPLPLVFSVSPFLGFCFMFVFLFWKSLMCLQLTECTAADYPEPPETQNSLKGFLFYIQLSCGWV